MAIFAVHLVLRIPLLFIRAPFFDELFSVWIAREDPSTILRLLRFDSGPPLYYFILHAFRQILYRGPALIDAVDAARFVSLAASVVALLLVMAARPLGESRWIAALLLALLPSHVYFSTEARAYAVCALFVGVASLLLMHFLETGDSRGLLLGCASLVVAAYTHYYGVLFFPLPLVLTVIRRRQSLVPGVLGSAGCGLAYIPGFLLASEQPAQAIAWLAATAPQGIHIVGSIVRQLGFAVPYPGNFLDSPPLWLQAASLLITIGVLSYGSIGSSRARILAAITLCPVIVLLLLSALRGTVYFPFRFESVLAVPFTLWFAVALERSPRRFRSLVLGVVLVIASFVSYSAILESARRPPDPFRQAAIFARERVPSTATIVATGPSYLELTCHRKPSWSPRLAAWPRAQAEHPGWRPFVLNSDLRKELTALPRDFFWVGETVSEEYRVLTQVAQMEPRFVNGPLMVARVQLGARRRPVAPQVPGRQ